VLGERRGSTLPPEQRHAVLHGIADPARALRRVKLDRSGSLCPGCGYRPQEVTTTGLCGVCHDNRLAWAHRQETRIITARRDLAAARQEKHRAQSR
jgi:hypothetical protein